MARRPGLSSRRRFLELGLVGATVGTAGCLRMGSTGTNTPSGQPENASFAFEYDRQNKRLTIEFTGGARIQAGKLQVQGTGGEKVSWPQLGSTSAAPDDMLTAGDTATVGADILNWGTAIKESETIRLVYQEEGAPTTIGQFSPSGSESGATSSETGASGWPLVHYDTKNTGSAPKRDGPQKQAKERWAVETGDAVTASPVIRNGLLYIGSHDEKVYAIDTETGDIAWTYQTSGGIFKAAAATAELVFVGSKQADVYALNSKDGSVEWQRSVGNSDNSVQAHTVTENRLYTSTSGDGQVVAFEQASGEIIWRFKADGGITNNIETAPAISDGTVVFGSNNSYIYAVDEANGNEIWRYDTGDEGLREGSSGGRVKGDPTIHDGTVYAGNSNGRVFALNLADGSKRWRFDAGAPVRSSPAIADGTLFFGTSEGQFYALDAASGTEKWKLSVGDGIRSSPTVTNNRVYFGCDDAKIYALTLDGNEKWTFETGDRVSATPAIVDQDLYIGSHDGSVYALTSE